jgi:hypothetical protein
MDAVGEERRELVVGGAEGEDLRRRIILPRAVRPQRFFDRRRVEASDLPQRAPRVRQRAQPSGLMRVARVDGIAGRVGDGVDLQRARARPQADDAVARTADDQLSAVEVRGEQRRVRGLRAQAQRLGPSERETRGPRVQLRDAARGRPARFAEQTLGGFDHEPRADVRVGRRGAAVGQDDVRPRAGLLRTARPLRA